MQESILLRNLYCRGLENQSREWSLDNCARRPWKEICKTRHITFSGEYANKTNQPVMYITERAVFELRKEGMYLLEAAPGIDIQTQIIDLMGFTPKIDGKVKVMDDRIFQQGTMGN